MNPVQAPVTQGLALVRSRLMREGARLSSDLIESEKARNNAVWADRRNWFLGFYFGRGDTRLWVPRRDERVADEGNMVINFSHPRGREAGKVLALAYVVCTLAVGVVGAIALGYRW